MNNKNQKHELRNWRTTPEQIFALITAILAVCCTVAAFVLPNWLVSWSRIHTPLNRLGLWEFCLDGLIHRLDPTLKSYFGCWWIFAPEYFPIKDYLQPPWFRTIQAFMTITLILHLVGIIFHLIYHCRCVTHPNRRAFICQMLCYVQFACGLIIFMVAIIFGVKYNDRYWMPYPELNWPSWGYGMAVLSGFMSFFTAFALLLQTKIEKKIMNEEGRYFPNMITKSTDKLTGSTSTVI